MLTFSDTFAGPLGTPPDPRYWTCCVDQQGGGNQELEYYTREAVACSPAGLVITASRDNGTYPAWNGPSQFLSGKIWSKGKFEFRYGHLDVTASIPAGLPGAWPAIWLLGADLDEVGWPACGELDVMESFAVNGNPSVISGSLHTPADNPTVACTLGTPATGLHTYSLDWRPSSVTWSADGRPYQTILKKNLASWPFDGPMFLILNLAIGGTMGGAVPPTAALPYRMIIKSVELYNAEVVRGPAVTI